MISLKNSVFIDQENIIKGTPKYIAFVNLWKVSMYFQQLGRV